jgi:hypothetical protein
MQKQLQPIPKFGNDDEEFEFWSTHDTTEYIDWSRVKPVAFPNLKPTEEVDLKLQELLVLREIERLAKQRHTSKRALIVQYLAEGIRNSAVPNSQIQ